MKHPNCACNITKFDYIRKLYKNGTLHLLRRCPQCGKIAPNAMRQDEYDARWVESLPVMVGGVMEQPVQSRIPAQKPGNPVQSRADAIHQKLQRHIENRNANL